MILILQCFSHKIAEFATFTLKVFRLIRHEEKWEKIKKNRIRNFKKEKKTHILIYHIKLFRLV